MISVAFTSSTTFGAFAFISNSNQDNHKVAKVAIESVSTGHHEERERKKGKFNFFSNLETKIFFLEEISRKNKHGNRANVFKYSDTIQH